jgi:predicted TIM-barrel fold metal-dependent hydrolase
MGHGTAISTDGAIDADGHILEPPDLWERYIDPQYRDRTLRVRTNAEGWEYLEFDGKPSKLMMPGFLGVLGAMGAPDINFSLDRTYLRSAPFGSMFPKERLKRLDQEGLAAALLYPTIGILWEAEVQDPKLAQAYTRAYNRWIVEFCSEDPKRLIPIAHISLSDPDLAAEEAERALKSGARGLFIHPFNWLRKSPGHPDFDRFWAIAEEFGAPVGIHPTVDPPILDGRIRFDELAPGEPFVFTWYFDVLVFQGIQQAFASLFSHALFDRFPRVKVVVLESQSGWIGQLLDRMDAVARGPLMPANTLKELPSTYFRRQCWISIDPDERAVTRMVPYVGDDRFFWASDFPHPDHTGDYLHELSECLAPLPPESQRKILTSNVAKAYNLV